MSEKGERIFEAIENIGDEKIEDALNSAANEKPKKSRSAAKWLALAASLALVAGAAVLAPKMFTVRTDCLIASAEYPAAEDVNDRIAYSKNAAQYRDSVNSFFDRSVKLLEPGDSNLVYSPLSLYLTLGMLSEVTAGQSREQLLSAVGADSLDTARAAAHVLWFGNYSNYTNGKCLCANSLWLSDVMMNSYNKTTLENVAGSYFASSFCGKMGSESYGRAFSDWLDAQTGSLLTEQANAAGRAFDPDTVLCTASALNFAAKWSDRFDESRTQSGIFHAPDGDVQCGFMKQTTQDQYYYFDDFAAVNRGFNASVGSMWFILPDEGVDVSDVLKSGDFVKLVTASWQECEKMENKKFVMVNWSMPKFDVVSDSDLTELMKKIGITDIFDAKTADFSPLCTDSGIPLWLSAAKQSARTVVDEEGVKAAAFTYEMTAGAALPPDEYVDFTLDRPFLFVIKDKAQLPMFVGVVNTP